MPALADGRVGLSFGRVADEYERVRPEYTEEAVDHVAWGLGLEPTATVLDLAAGTGKLTRVLQRRFGWMGWSVRRHAPHPQRARPVRSVAEGSSPNWRL